MTPGAHVLISGLSTVEILKNRRERTLVALSGVTPDIDGLAIIVNKISGSSNYFFQYHHYLGHSILSALVCASTVALLAKTQRVTVLLMSFLVVHIHILCDVIGSRGPNGYQWPVYYLYPFNNTFGLTWSYQWELNAWPNIAIMIVLLSGCFYYSVTRKITFIEAFSERIDKQIFIMLKKHFGKNV